MNNTSKTKNQPNGRAFKVTITETYQRTITVYESEMKPSVLRRIGGRTAKSNWEPKISRESK